MSDSKISYEMKQGVEYVVVELGPRDLAAVNFNRGFCVDITELLQTARKQAVLNFLENGAEMNSDGEVDVVRRASL